MKKLIGCMFLICTLTSSAMQQKQKPDSGMVRILTFTRHKTPGTSPVSYTRSAHFDIPRYVARKWSLFNSMPSLQTTINLRRKQYTKDTPDKSLLQSMFRCMDNPKHGQTIEHKTLVPLWRTMHMLGAPEESMAEIWPLIYQKGLCHSLLPAEQTVLEAHGNQLDANFMSKDNSYFNQYITHIPIQNIQPSPSANVVYLRGNFLHRLELPRLCQLFPYARIFYLTNNCIAHIPHNAFNALKQTYHQGERKLLYLKHNHLTDDTVDERAFKNLQGWDIVVGNQLSDRKIELIKKAMEPSFSRKLADKILGTEVNKEKYFLPTIGSMALVLIPIIYLSYKFARFCTAKITSKLGELKEAIRTTQAWKVFESCAQKEGLEISEKMFDIFLKFKKPEGYQTLVNVLATYIPHSDAARNHEFVIYLITSMSSFLGASYMMDYLLTELAQKHRPFCRSRIKRR